MTYKEIYKNLIEEIKKDVYISHRYMGKTLAGFYDSEYNIIVINSVLKYKKEGVFALAHEYTHYKDFKAGKFKRFFDIRLGEKYTDSMMRQIVKAEQSAGRGAAKICKKYGRIYKPEELDKEKLKKLKVFWKKYYFSDCRTNIFK